MRRLTLIALVAIACTGDPVSGPVEIAWDRDTCEHCGMSIGDRRFAAQIRSPEDHRVRRFDDLGCALLWLDERPWRDRPEEMWVRDSAGEGWLDAAKARYVAGERTPMGYGLGAIAAGEGIDLDAARERIRKVERERRGSGH
jgi:nitrous oxide reductase accessory protein NosL